LSFSTLEAREQLQGNKDVNFHLQGEKKKNDLAGAHLTVDTALDCSPLRGVCPLNK